MKFQKSCVAIIDKIIEKLKERCPLNFCILWNAIYLFPAFHYSDITKFRIEAEANIDFALWDLLCFVIVCSVFVWRIWNYINSFQANVQKIQDIQRFSVLWGYRNGRVVKMGWLRVAFHWRQLWTLFLVQIQEICS